MKNTIEIKNLTKKYQNFSLKNISLNIPSGTIVGLIGENGAGKTTLIKSLLNIINIDSGTIKIFDKDYKQYEKDLENHIIYTHDEASFSVPTNYCEAVTLYPLLLNGTSTMDGLKTKPPHNLNSF